MKNRLFLALLLQLAVAPVSVLAQPSAFTYQGRLLDRGQPANGCYDLRFTLANAFIKGDYVAGPVTNTAVSATNGVFTVALDFGAGAFDGSARWLEIGVRTNGSSSPYTLLSPRQAITGTPYAGFANKAATAVVAASLTPGVVITANGVGITNLNGRYIQPGTINSNRFDPGTAALLAQARAGGGVLASGSSATNLTLWAGSNSFGMTYALAQGRDLVVSGCSDANANGTYIYSGYYYYSDRGRGDGYVTNYAGPHYGLSLDFPHLRGLLPHPLTITNGAGRSVLCFDNRSIPFPDGIGPLVANGIPDWGSQVGWSTNRVATGFQFTGTGAVAASGTVSSPDFTGGGLHCTNLSFAPLQLAGLQSRPAMVWNSYAEFDDGTCFKDTPGGYQAAFLAKLQKLRDNGALAAGYNIAWLDYCWGGRADFNSDLTNNAVYFPGGIPFLVNATHALGFRFGIYLCWNDSTTAGLQPATTPATTMRDIALLASWGVDAIKWDGAIAATDAHYTDRDAVVLAANCIKATGRNLLIDMTLPHMPDDRMTLPPSVFPMDIPLSAQIWELSNVQELVSSVHATMIAANHFEPIAWGNGPGHCGQLVWAYSKLGVQAFTNCVNCNVMWPSPLMGDLGDNTLQYATNAEIIAIDQDPAVIPHSVIYSNGWNYIWARPLGLPPNYVPSQDRAYRPAAANAVLFINGNTDGGSASFTITSAQLKQPAGTTFLVRDPWQHLNLGYHADSFSARIAQNSTALYVLYVMPSFALAGLTNAAPPTNATTVRAWLNFTNSSDGSVYKVPLYQ